MNKTTASSACMHPNRKAAPSSGAGICKRPLKGVIFCFFISLAIAKPVIPELPEKPARFSFNGVSVSQVINLVYAEALRQSYVLSPDVLKDDRIVSFRFDSTKGQLSKFWRDFMDVLGYSIIQKNGTDYIVKTPDINEPKKSDFIYFPNFRNANYLNTLIRPFFSVEVLQNASGKLSDDAKAKDAKPGSASDLLDKDSAVISFRGTSEDITRLKSILKQIDVPEEEVIVKATVYEVAYNTQEGNAFSLALNILKNANVVLSSASFENQLSIKSDSINAVFSALNSDTRFSLVTSPRIRTISGQSARLVVGSDVPTLSAVTQNQTGQQIQSVNYKTSGVLFDITPKVKQQIIEVDLNHEISNFTATTSGVNTSPTLLKRSITTKTNLQDGEAILIGGLTESRDNDSKSGFSFLPDFLNSKSKQNNKTDILILVQVQKIVR